MTCISAGQHTAQRGIGVKESLSPELTARTWPSMSSLTPLRRNLTAVAGTVLLLITLTMPAHAAARELDVTFRSDSTLRTDVGGHVGIGYPMAL